MSAIIDHLNRPFTPPPYRAPTMAELQPDYRESDIAAVGHVDVTHWRGRRLPLRVEFNIDREKLVHQLVDADHRRVDVSGDFDQLRRMMIDANGTASSRNVRTNRVLRGEELSHVERLSDLHPCNRHRVRYGLAFECMLAGRHTDWITNVDLWQLKAGVGVLESNMTPKRKYAHRWLEWRLAENDALRRRKML